jgi:CHAD domain-containing protein
MAFHFKRNEPVPKAIRRLTRERIEDALECLKQSDRAEAVHCARKDIKKVRAVLRLVRAGIGKKEFRRLSKRLREAATHLAALRDAYVKDRTVREVAGHFKGQLAPGSLRHVRSALRMGFDEEKKRFAKAKTARGVARILGGTARELKRLETTGQEWKALGPGVKTAYRQGRSAYRTVLTDSSAANFHEWRKRAKDLWYQVSLLQPVWPEQMDAMAGELEKLGEYLGDDHDLCVLQLAVEERTVGLDNDHPRELQVLTGLIEQRHHELRSAALALGARFYADKPTAICNRLGRYWEIWRRGKKAIRPSAKAVG